MVNRSDDWLKQAKHLLAQAKWSLEGDFFDGVCFLAQQSSEMAVKAVCQNLRIECWGHSITSLLHSIKSEIDLSEQILTSAKKLDKYYIQSRCPNGFVSGAPKDYFIPEEAVQAINDAEKIISFCEEYL